MKIETEHVAKAIFEIFGGSGWDDLSSNVREVYWKGAEAAIANVLHQQHEAKMQKEMEHIRTLERESAARQLKQYQQQLKQGEGYEV